MLAYIALLRAVNVGGRTLLMAELRAKLQKAGLDDVRTLLQSGNVVFRSKEKRDRLIQRLEEITDTIVVLRDAAEWDAIVAGNPFPSEAKSDPGRLIVMACSEVPRSIDELRAAIVGRERVEANGKQLYIYYPDGSGASKFTNALIERKSGTRGTARNWNTVLKIQAALRG